MTGEEPALAAPPVATERWGWRRSALLLVWCAAFVLVYFARDITLTVAGWPVAFWLASQGLILMFVALVVVWVRWDADPPAEDGTP